MTHGRKVCNTLKEIRRQIADKNEIEYTTDDCSFEGECKGTCPKCDAEVKYLEKELHKRTQLGKAVAVAGISLGIAGTFPACNAPQKTNTRISEQEIVEIMPEISIIPNDSDKEVLELDVSGKAELIEDDIYIPIGKIVPIEEPVEDTSGFSDF
ncbi:MAG: hypothetical protein FWH36_06400 [Lentimicrobiaceae bacterium]|nr:hypothetical protein [Lentimicrobiaceae bacterium]